MSDKLNKSKQKPEEKFEKIILEAESVDPNENKETKENSKESQKTTETKFEFKDIIKILRDFFVGKLPTLPNETAGMIVKYLQYIQLVPVVLAVLTILNTLNILNSVNVVNVTNVYLVPNPISLILRIILLAMAIVFGIMSYTPLSKMEYRGWKYFYWGVWVNFGLSLLSFDIFGILFGAGIGFYVAMQIESRYK